MTLTVDRKSAHHWSKMPNAKLLSVRLRDLNLRFEDSNLISYEQRLLTELSLSGIFHLRPRVYFGAEWFSPDRTVAISVPFYLASKKLFNLVKSSGALAEGDDRWFMRYLRHEAGHTFDHAYDIAAQPEFRRIFKKVELPEDLEASKSFFAKNHLKNLPGQYAAIDPVEDFAETFAVWLGASEAKRSTLRSVKMPPAIRAKILYLERLVENLGPQTNVQTDRRPMSPLQSLRSSLAKYCKDFSRLN
jgi:hypothetical protein